MPQLIERAVGRLEQDGQSRSDSSFNGVSSLHGPKASIEGPENPVTGIAPGEGATRGSQSATFELPCGKLRRQGLLTPQEGRSRLSEEIRLVKRQLMKNMALDRSGRGRNEARIVMVTSARAGEGKSFVALNLALSIAIDEGTLALLVDADHTRSRVSDLLGLPRAPGLIDALLDPCTVVASLVWRCNGLPFAFLPPGRTVASATALFGGAGMGVLLGEACRLDQDIVVVIDAPPLLSATEAMELAPRAGQVLMVVEAEATTDVALHSALALLEPCSNVSLVLNKASRFTAAVFDPYDRKAISG